MSAIYTGRLRHRRLIDVEHGFAHPVNFLLLDLEELPKLLGGRLTRARPGAWRYRRRDYHGSPDTPLDVAVRDSVERQLAMRPSGPVRMLTQLRCYGMAFNPVTLYYLYDADASGVQAVLAEVTNTPWRERHAYALGPFTAGRVLRSRRAKTMHVSPFLGMSHDYEITLTPPADTLSVHISLPGPAGPAFDATLGLTRTELDNASLDRLIRHDPVAPLRTLGRIYAQGLALKRAGAPVHPHPQQGSA